MRRDPLELDPYEALLNTPAEKLSLDELRQAIDATDSDIASSVARRLKLAQKVGEVKQQSPNHQGLVLRPDREAQLLRKWVSHLSSSLSPLAVQQLWRLLISSSCLHEQDLHIHLPNTTEAKLEADRYFGSFFPKSHYEELDSSTLHLNSNQDILILEPSHLSELSIQTLNEWLNQTRFKCFLSLPFISMQTTSPHLCFADVPVNDSGDNVTLICIKDSLDSSHYPKHRVISDLGSYTLIAFEGYLDETAIRATLADMDPDAWTYWGSFPVVIEV